MVHQVEAKFAFGSFMLTATAEYLRVPFANNSLVPIPLLELMNPTTNICHWEGLLLVLLDPKQGIV